MLSSSGFGSSKAGKDSVVKTGAASIYQNQRLFTQDTNPAKINDPKNQTKRFDVAVIMGSTSDYEVMQEAVVILKDFGITHDTLVISAHRTPDRMFDFAKEAQQIGFKIIIAGAGGAAHLPGMVASITTLPVIGVPVKTKFNDGLDSLLSIAQMPSGVPVATMAVNGAKNAAIFAAQILAINNPEIHDKINKFKLNQSRNVPNRPTSTEQDTTVNIN